MSAGLWDDEAAVGRLRVCAVRRADPPIWWVVDGDDRGLCCAFAEPSAHEAARRLAAGAPLRSPAERLARLLSLYPGLYGSRLWYAHRSYLCDRGDDGWTNGGLFEQDATDLTDEGAEWLRSRMARDAAARAASLAEFDPEAAAELARRWSGEHDGVGLWPAYLAGAWPDVAPSRANGSEGRRVLGGEHLDRSPIARLARGEAGEVRADWLDDARRSLRFALPLVEDHPLAPGAPAALRAFAAALTARHGGDWGG